MDGKTLKQKRIQLEATQNELADAVHVNYRTIIRWEKRNKDVPYLVEHFINQMIQKKLNDIR